MRRWVGLMLLFIGIAIVVYNFQEWNTGRTAAQDITEKEVQDFKEIAQSIEKEMIFTPPPVESVPSPLLTADVSHETGGEIATLLIPKIEQKYSVYWGTDPSVLNQGVGVFVSDLTTVPGGYGHTVLSGHRDTVFTRLGELEKADLLHVQYETKTYVYEVMDSWITHEDDRTVIVEKDESILTLTTCYPFDFIGYASDRYIVQARLVGEHDIAD
ncbi:LPXTG-site transpeptidase family protein [Planococcus halocryophilus Or1]|uniref:Class D sortase n=1 Tax=Planococcus halocryophilus TaxID=1215089 RepID=A0A1C7DUT5_9BACL|nr:class D sortase [Planococcus halocryophilus]ANU15225.1 class D sortase [Planococcus halocryophilus]EMF46974.1 LPXTG-site transpeptidase family protein [Planococcus halocryophilus Or1]